MKTEMRLGVIILLCKVFLCGLAEESVCTPGFESELLVFKVQRDHLYKGKTLGRVNFNTCDGKTRILFQSDDKRFDVNMDGTVTLKRSLTLHEGYEVFTVHAWDANGKKHTVSIRVEYVDHLKGHQMDTVMNISSKMKPHFDDMILTFPKSSTGLKRAKRGWVIPPVNIPENSRGPFPMKLVQIKSDFALETQMVYSITGEGADQDPKGIFTIERLTGNLYVTQPLKREKKASYRLIVHATGLGVNIAEKPMEIVISVIDQNDNKPVFTQNPFNAKRGWVIPPVNIPENSRGPFPMKLVQIKSDFALETQMVYSITGEGADQDPKGIFTIERLSGNLMVTQPLDREKKASYRLVAHATGLGVNIAEKPMDIVIIVSDQNDNKPVFTQNPFNGSVHEAAEIGYEFMTVTATDADDPNEYNGIVSYAIVSQEPQLPKTNMFEINNSTGIIRVRELGMDRKQWPRYTLLIEAADMNGYGLSTNGTAVITVTDDSDKEPHFEQTSWFSFCFV
ncbi:cadherin-1 isoform X2 [Labeo rohita]|uniref:cadherin-1 isoform X2 n=1 Tax=Labeo rohita TaxID=84645 RepID=UPI0021E23F97|nr:cadherin-1 isoform X2 [Labeo rohita]